MSKARDIASAAPAPSTVSATELGYLDGVSSAIQTQIDDKTAKNTLTTTGDIYYASSANTPARLGIGSTGNVLTVASGVPSWAAPAGGSSGPAFRANRATSNQSLTQDVFTKVQFNAESFDTDNCFDSTTNYRFTPNKSGYYLFQSNILFDNAGTTDRQLIMFYFNGSNDARTYDGVGGITGPARNGSVLKYFNGTTDFMEVYVLTKSTAAGVFPGAEFSFFSGVWIRS